MDLDRNLGHRDRDGRDGRRGDRYGDLRPSDSPGNERRQSCADATHHDRRACAGATQPRNDVTACQKRRCVGRVGGHGDLRSGPPADVDALPDSDMWKWLYQRYNEPVPTWAPGWTLSNVIRAGHDPLDPVSVTLSYRGPDGLHYSDVYALNPDHVTKATTSTPSKVTDPVKLEQQKISALQALVRTLRER